MASIRIHAVLQKGGVLTSSIHQSCITAALSSRVAGKTTNFRLFSSQTKKNEPIHKDEKKITKSVFISQSNDIFTNLALEDWMYKNFDFTNHHVMLLWINSPCVVIGRHQNPWLEANIGHGTDQDLQLARRNSGGGTVYHDNGNLNMTFFTPRERYNRKENLEVVTSALNREWGLKAEINKKDDIIIDGINKISGTASKLGRPNSYHHCTLLVDVNKKQLSETLHRYDKGIETNATASIPSAVKNLAEFNPSINTHRLISSLGWEYMRRTAISQTDGGWDQVSKQRGFQMINPTDAWFPGLENIRCQFESWDWRYGKTPKFHITKSFPVPQQQEEQLRVTVTVDHGLVEDVIMMIPPSLMRSQHFVEDVKLMTNIRGRRFTEDAVDELNASFGTQALQDNSKQFVADCVRQMMAAV